MKRAFLEELGLEKETIDKVMAENGKDIEKAKGSLSDVQAELEKAKSELTERDSQLETLKKSAKDNENLQSQIEKLQADNKQIKFDNALEKALLGAKAKNIKAVKANLDLEDSKLLDDGTIRGLSEQLEKLKESDSYLFESDKKPKEKGQQNIKGASPGQGSDDNNPVVYTPEDIKKMSADEINANFDAIKASLKN